jgi:hypothetical protein
MTQRQHLSLRLLLLMMVMTIFQFGFSQTETTYPTDPGFDKALADFKKNFDYKAYLNSIGLTNDQMARVKFERMNERDKNYNQERVYYRQNAISFNDALMWGFIMNIPKDVFGGTFRVYCFTTYTRYEETGGGNWTILKNWQFSGAGLDHEVILTPTDVPAITPEGRVALIRAFLNKPMNESVLKFSDMDEVIKVNAIMDYVYNPLYMTHRIGTYLWQVAMDIEKGGRRSSATTTDIERTCQIYNFEVAYKNGKYEVLGLIKAAGGCDSEESTRIGVDYSNKRLTEPQAYGNLLDNGFDAVFRQYAPKISAACSEADQIAKANAMAKASFGLTFSNDTEIAAISGFFREEEMAKMYYNMLKELADGGKKLNFLVDAVSVYQEEQDMMVQVVPAMGVSRFKVEITWTTQRQINKKQTASETHEDERIISVAWVCRDGQYLIEDME